MPIRQCFHCKEVIKEGLAHDCWTTTEEALTRDLITDGLPRLKEALAQSGMEVAQVNVNVRQEGQNGGNSTPGRQKAPTAISGVSKSSPATAGLPIANLATKQSAADNNGLDILV